MTEISATKAARSFADVLDSVEHDGERFTIMRHGKAVARIEPIGGANGDAVRDALQGWLPSPAFADAVRETRGLLAAEERS